MQKDLCKPLYRWWILTCFVLFYVTLKFEDPRVSCITSLYQVFFTPEKWNLGSKSPKNFQVTTIWTSETKYPEVRFPHTTYLAISVFDR